MLSCTILTHKRRHGQGSEAMLADSQWRRILIHIFLQLGLRLQGLCGGRIMTAARLRAKETQTVSSELPEGMRRDGARNQVGHMGWRRMLCFARSFMRTFGSSEWPCFSGQPSSALWVESWLSYIILNFIHLHHSNGAARRHACTDKHTYIRFFDSTKPFIPLPYQTKSKNKQQ